MLAAALVELGSRSERLQVERAAIAALDGLRASSGGYLEELGPYAGELSGSDVDVVKNRLLGRAPAILISTGDGDYDTRSMTRRRAVVEIELHVDVVSAHLRSRESRTSGDEAGALGQGDPGIYAMLADVRDRLMGAELGVAGASPPIISTEEAVLQGEDLSIYRATYLVRCAVTAAAPSGAPVRALESIQHNENLADSAGVNPVASGEITP